MNINKKLIILILILGMAIFSGCVQKDGKTVYFSKKSNDTITLYDDNTITDINPKASISGAYRIDGDYVIMSFPPFGAVVKLKKSGNTLVDEKDGETWVKI